MLAVLFSFTSCVSCNDANLITTSSISFQPFFLLFFYYVLSFIVYFVLMFEAAVLAILFHFMIWVCCTDAELIPTYSDSLPTLLSVLSIFYTFS